MASIRKRTSNSGTKYQVQIRRSGHQPVIQSFNTLKDAQTFAKDIEVKIERSVYQCAKDAEHITFGELADRYLKEILVNKKGYDKERYNIRPVIRFFKDYKLINVRPHVVAAFKKHRLDEVSPGTVKRELGLISRILVSAERDFGIYLPQGNPVSQIKKPIETARDRRPTGEELEILISDKTIGHYVTFAIETGMRRGEIVNIKPKHLLGEQQNLLVIPETKTGIPRTIPLSARAQEALNKLLYATNCRPILKPHSVSQAFLRACKRHSIDDLRFHDLRHEATSRFFEKGLNIMEVSLITGHKSLSMLNRYTHLKPESLLEKLECFDPV
jgi:integrase